MSIMRRRPRPIEFCVATRLMLGESATSSYIKLWVHLLDLDCAAAVCASRAWNLRFQLLVLSGEGERESDIMWMEKKVHDRSVYER
jgi:hypothetical protein